MVSMELTAAAAGHPGPRTGNDRNGQEEADLQRLATGDLLARIAGFLSVREGDVQSVLVAAPPAERITFREDYLSNNITAFLSQAVIPAVGGVIQNLASQWAQHKIKAVLATPAGAKFLRQSAASVGRPYALDSDGRINFDPSRAFANVSFAIALDNYELLEWAMEVGSLDPNGYHDEYLLADDEVDDGQEEHLLYMSICYGSTECFDWLLAREDVDHNASAFVRPGSDRWYSIVSACIICAYIGYDGDVTYFLRRLIKHTADINVPSTSIGQTPFQLWAVLFASYVDIGDAVTLEGALRILNCLLEGGAKCRRSGILPDATPAPFDMVLGGTISGSLEHRARHLLALDLIRGGGVVSCLLLLGKGTSAVDRMHGMVASALKLGLPSIFIDFLFELVRVITIPPFVVKRWLTFVIERGLTFVIKRGLNDFIEELFHLMLALGFYYKMICT